MMKNFESLEDRLLLTVFTADRDNTLYETVDGSRSNGAGTDIFAGRTGTNAGTTIRRGLIHFDLSSIPAGATVTGATLDLAVTRDPAGPTPAHDFMLHRVTQDWGEGTSIAGGAGGQGVAPTTGDATWLHTNFNTTTWTTPGGDFDATASATASVGNSGSTATWTSADLIADVQGWVNNPGTNFGWVILGDESSTLNARRFSSREGATPPALDVTFTAAAPTVTLAVDSAAIPEAGGVATATATLSAAATADVTIDLAISGTATAATDYTSSGTQIVIPTGSTSGSVTFTAVQDAVPEVDETIVVDIDAVTNATEAEAQQITTTITDDDPEPTVTLLVDNATIAENNGTAQITAVLSGVSGAPVTVDLAYTGTATVDTDYTAPTQIVIPAGSLNGSITVSAVQDVVFDEGDETIVATIQAVTNASGSGSQTITITDDDITPTVTLGIDTTTLNEAVGLATLTATISVVSGLPVTIDLAYSGSATLTDDFTAPTQLLIDAGNLNATAQINVVSDLLDEADETIIVDVAAVTNANESGEQQVTATITDDDEPPSVTLSVNNATIPEAAGEAIFTATLSEISGLDVTVDLAITGTATAVDDYTTPGTQLVIPAGAAFATWTLTAVQDTLDENDETLLVEITEVTNGTESGEQQQTTTIVDDDDPPAVTLAVDNADIAETGGVATFTATLSAASSFPVTVDFAASGTATVTDDYTLSGTQVVIAPGDTSATVTVTAVDDAVIDPAETIVLDIAAVTNGTETGDQQATVTITDNDEPTVTLSVDPATIVEAAGVATFTATLSGASTLPVTVDLEVTGTATATDDYTISATQIVIAPGSTSGSVTVTAVDDTTDEADETVIVDIAAVTNGLEDGTQQQTATITDDDEPLTVSLSLDPATIAEDGGVATFTATLSAASGQDVTVDLAVTGTATGTDDYTLSGTQIVIAAGSTSGSVTVTAVQDALDEADETVIVDITAITNALPSGAQQQTATITDDDEAPTVTLAVDPATIPEADGVAVFTVTLSAASGLDVTVGLAATGTATNVDDYAISETELVIPAGETSGTVTVTAVQDTADEPDETVILDIASVTNGTEVDTQQQTITITDDDAPEVTLTVDPAAIAEEAGVTTFTATLSSTSSDPITIDLAFSGTATDTNDYVASATQIVIPADSTSGSITVTAVQDTVDEADETIVVDVASVTNGQEAGDQQATATIQDDDDSPTVTLAVDVETIAEDGGVATITATLSVASEQDATIDLAFSGTADAADYNASATQIVIPAGSTSASITVTAVQDVSPEGDHTVVVDIDTATNAVEDGTQQVTTTIVDDDPLPNVNLLLLTPANIPENGGQADVAAFLSGPSGVDVIIDLEFTGTATLDEDFTAPAQIIIPAGSLNASIRFFSINDNLDEDDETIVATATNVTGANGGGSATITILDDDINPDVTIQVTPASFVESIGAIQPATITLFLSTVASVPVTVDLEYGGLATLDTDFTAPTQLVINPGVLNVSGFIRSINDTLDEPDEDIVVGIATVTNANEAGEQSGTTTILDDDPSPDVTFALDNDSIPEADGVATLTATLSTVSGQDVTINLTIGGTATGVDDYTAATQIVIPAGSTTGTVTVNAVQDPTDEVDETVVLTVSDVVNANPTGAQEFTTTIVDDDDPPTVTLSVDNESISEAAGIAVVTATLSAASSLPVTVDLAISGTATGTDDYTVSATQIVIAPGETSGSASITAVNDELEEDNETVVVDIAAVENGTEVDTQQVTTTILDDDSNPPEVTLSVDNASIAETGGSATVTATLSAATSLPVTVDLEITGTATVTDDYTASATQIVIDAGATSGTIVISAVSDDLDEPDETVVVDIANVVNGTEAGTQQQTITISDDDDPLALVVTSLTANSTGFVAEFNNDLNGEVLNLYATQSGLGPADVIVTGATSGPVTGSIAVDAGARSFTFIKTGDVLAADTYTVTFRSGTDAFVSVGGLLLDGDANGTPGDDYTTTFEVADPAANAVTLSLPDFVRGPAQDVNVPANETGLPVTISDGTGVRNVTFQIDYNPAFLTITGAATGAAMPEGATVNLDTSTPGRAIVTFASTVDLPAGANTLVNLTATVPTVDANSIYRSKGIMDINTIAITDASANPVPGIDNDSLHVVEFFGDVSANARLNAADASQVARIAALLDDGFGGSQLADPMIIGDITGNGRLNAADASRVAQFAALIPVDEIPAIPVGVVTSPIIGGPDPKLSIGSVEGAAGSSITVPVEIDSIVNLQQPNRLAGIGLVVEYDPAVLTATGVSNGTFITSNPGWSVVPNTGVAGRIVVVAFTSSPVGGQFIDNLVNLEFDIAANAPSGATALNLVPAAAGAFTELLDENDGVLVLEPAPTAATDDEVDGAVTVTGGAPTVSLAVDNADIAENGGVATVTATLSEAATADVTVDLAYSGTATDGADYTASATQITIATGATSGTATITAVDDAEDDNDETVIVDIVNVAGGANEAGEQQVTTTITDDDEPAREAGNRISIPMDIVAGAGEAVTVPINIELLNLSQAAGNRLAGVGVAATYDPAVLTLDGVTNGSFITGNPGWSLVPNTGTAGTVVLVGFTSSPVAGTLEDVLANLNFTVAANAAPGSETVINVVAQAGPAFTELLDENDGVLAFVDPITNDPTDAGDGRVTIGAAGPTVSLSIDPADIAENGGVATVTATLSEALTADVTVDLGISGTATDGDDYTASATQITIAAGSTTGAVTINAVDDDIDDDDETVVVDITNVVGASENGDQQVTATIIDDDEPVVLPTVSIAVDNAEIAENGGTATVTATLSAAATSDVVIDLAYSGTATNGDDYTASATQITIATGATSGTVDIVAVDDATDEPNETVIVDVTVSGGANEDGDQQVTTTILDDDVPAREPGNRISIPMDIVAGAGEAVTVPINIELLNLSQAAGNRLAGVGVAATYDPAVLTLNSVDNGSFITGNPGWSLVPNTGTAGTVVLVGFTSSPVAGTLEDVLANLNFTVAANAAPGSETVINVVAQAGPAFTELLDENDGVLAFVDPITNDPTDAGDGRVTIGAAGPTVSLSIDPADIAENGGVATVTATLSEALTADVTVDLGISGTATDGDDYTASATQITIAAGSTTGAVTINAVDDDIDDDDETVVVDITNVVGATENGDQQVTATIIDDDEPVVLPTVSIAVDNAEIAENGGTATVTATLSAAATSDVVIDLAYSGTATNGDDYTASATQITIATGATSGTVDIVAVDDATDEPNETVIVDVTVSGGANEDGDQQVTTTILDDDVPAREPGNRISIPMDIVAGAGEEVVVPINIELLNLSQAAGNRLAGVGVAATYDPAVLTLNSVDNGTFITGNPGWSLVPNTGTAGTVVLVGFTSSPVAGTLEDVLANLNFTVAANAAPGSETVINVVAQAGGAFTELLDENDGVLAFIDPITNDPTDAGDGIVTIAGDAGPTVALSIDNTSLAEDGGTATVTATLSAAVTADVVVDLGLSGTATNPDDYTASATQITIAAGATSGTATITAINDDVDEEDETVVIDITGVTGATEAGDQQVTATIVDDDDPVVPTVTLTVDNADIAEAGGVATFTATLSAAATADVTVDLGFTGTATDGTDYTASATQITIATGSTSGTVTVTAVDDDADEENETVIVDIVAANGATEDGDQQATTTITDDDEPALPTVTLTVDNADIAEAGGVATFTATLSAAATADVTVDLGFTGTATDGTDYTASATQITIATGSTSGTVTVTAVDDDADEENETVIVDIVAATGAEEDGDQQATTTITDDDEPVVPTVTLAVDLDSIPENGGVATFTATLSAAATADVVVDLGVTGTAANGADYTLSGTQITIATGATTGTVTVTAIDDADDEPDETVALDITNVTGATGSGAAVTTITDDDEPGPSVSLAIDAESIVEAEGVATVTATLSQALTADVTVDLAYSGTATNGTDYTASATQITIAAGATTGTATITAVQDTEVEPGETVIVDIAAVAGADEDGEQQVTTTIVDDDSGVNEPPVLTNPGDQSFPETQDTLDVTLEAVDPNLQPLTYSVTIEAAELFLDQTLDLGLSGELFTNFSGFLNEKWVLGGDGRTWYYIEPSGDFYRWLGGNVLNREFVAGLSSATYDNPALLYDAQPGATVPVTTTVTGNVVTLDPADGFNGSFTVIATVSDGELSDTESFLVNVEPNQAPTLIDPGSQTLPTTQDTLDVTLQATDPMDDPITFTAELQSAEYYLDQTIGFQLGPNGLEPNWSGSADERWVVSNDSSTWYFITPDGSLYRWLGGGRNILDNAELVATLSPATHADPALLYDAQAGVGTPNATVSVNGNILTIDPAAGFVGTFGVLITATDIGGLTDTALINVDVTAAPAAAIQIPLNLNLDLSAGGAEKAADQAIAAGELGFVEDSLGMAEELGQLAGGNAGTENSDAALDELFNDDLLGNDLTQSLALDLIKKDQ